MKPTTRHMSLVPTTTSDLSRLLGVSDDAVALCQQSLFLDLHIDTLIPPRLAGYDIFKAHRPWFGGRFFGHLDVPRMEAVHLDGAMWSITTNPFRTAKSRYRVFKNNLNRFTALMDQYPERLRWIRKSSELRGEGIGVLLSIQGGNALQAADSEIWPMLDQRLTRVTLVHLTNSVYGASNAPIHKLRRHKGLTQSGRS